MLHFLFNTFVVVGCLSAICTCVLMIFLIGFVVNLRDKLKEFFSDLMSVMTEFETPTLPVVDPPVRRKTWDEKFEEELAERERRMRMDSGLNDLPPPRATFGEPPVANKGAQEGLILTENKGNMRPS